MKQSRTRLSLAIISGILPLFFMLALIVPLWIFFTGERYFLSTLLHFAEVPLTDNPARAPGMVRACCCWPCCIFRPPCLPLLSGRA